MGHWKWLLRWWSAGGWLQSGLLQALSQWSAQRWHYSSFWWAGCVLLSVITLNYLLFQPLTLTSVMSVDTLHGHWLIISSGRRVSLSILDCTMWILVTLTGREHQRSLLLFLLRLSKITASLHSDWCMVCTKAILHVIIVFIILPSFLIRFLLDIFAMKKQCI